MYCTLLCGYGANNANTTSRLTFTTYKWNVTSFLPANSDFRGKWNVPWAIKPEQKRLHQNPQPQISARFHCNVRTSAVTLDHFVLRHHWTRDLLLQKPPGGVGCWSCTEVVWLWPIRLPLRCIPGPDQVLAEPKLTPTPNLLLFCLHKTFNKQICT